MKPVDPEIELLDVGEPMSVLDELVELVRELVPREVELHETVQTWIREEALDAPLLGLTRREPASETEPLELWQRAHPPDDLVEAALGSALFERQRDEVLRASKVVDHVERDDVALELERAQLRKPN